MLFGLPITFSPDLADKILDAGRRGLSPDDAEHGDLTLWFHLLTVATALCLSKDFSVKMVETLYEHQVDFEAMLKAQVLEVEPDDFRRTAIDPTH
tara:strand:- start:56 stop:340 length:285 start_codon:yes stop_codon:yes gene_type:complete